MGELTKIAWAHGTFNPWRGCQEVSPGCDHCYARTWSKRNPGLFGTWGEGGTRVVASDKAWNEPRKWDAKAKAEGQPRRIFCASLADWLEDRPDLVAPRARLVTLIEETPHLDWLLLSKRLENFARLAPTSWLKRCPENVWIGTTCEDQERTNLRVPILLTINAHVRFISAEPLLGPIDLTPWLTSPVPHIDWVIPGGESGGRVCDLAWIRSLVQQCAEAGTACFVKQLGSNVVVAGGRVTTVQKKGDDVSEWPAVLQVRQVPTTAWMGL